MHRLALVVLALGCSSGADDAPAPADAGDPFEYARAPRTCIYDCPQTDCKELDAGYACPSLGEWGQLPHAEECPALTTPAPVTGKCAASAPTGEAAKYTGVDGATKILPDGRRVKPAGKELAFTDATGGLPTAVIVLPGTRRAVTVDTGYGAHMVRAIDLDSMTVVGKLAFNRPKTLNSGVTFVAPDLLYVATSEGVAQAIKIDPTGALTLDEARTIKLPPAKARDGGTIAWHTASLAASPDGKRLVIGAVLEKRALVYDLTTREKVSEVDLGAGETFAVAFDPLDSAHAYVSLWGSRAVAEIDLATGGVRKFATDKNPQGMAFLDARWLAVANSHGDTISLVDRVAGSVTAIPIDTRKTHGFDPSSLAYDAPRKRLYATLAGFNAIAAFEVDTAATLVKPVGRIPTGWWPGAVAVADDGTLAIANMRAAFIGPNPTVYPAIDDGDVMGRTYGSFQSVPPPSAAELTTGEAEVRANNDVAALAGSPKVECGGAPWDFPIPRTNTEGRSKQIEHIFFVVRENKTFDGLFGDMPGVNGKPDLIMAKDAATQERIWGNLRALARDFAHSDNAYTGAELSQQGHFWTVYGRSSDYNERTWAVDGYTRNIRGLPLPSGGVLDIGQPVEGSSFDWLARGGIGFEIFGEALGLPHEKIPGRTPVDANYPGGFIQSMGHPDVEKSCHLLGRVRVLCDVRSFAYITLPNDHTVGVSPKSPTPDAMIAVNDEATGMLVDGISKSTYWPKSLIIITEDDPANGGEHVDIHRVPVVLVSPWIKRGYVSKTHIDVSSLHKIFAHVYGLPYPNVQVEGAAIPWDAFTSTPDFRPWNRKKRDYPITCGATASKAEALLTESFDLDRVDESPGLNRQIERWLREKPLMSLPPAIEAAARARIAAKAAGAPPEEDDD